MSLDLKKLSKSSNKKILTIVAIVVIVLLFIVFLSSLSSDENKTADEVNNIAIESEITTSGEINAPIKDRYDYEKDLSSLLDSNTNIGPSNNAVTENQQVTTTEENIESTQETSQDNIINENTTLKSYLYCDSFQDSKSADSVKAQIAYSLGIVATISRSTDNTYTLKIGPFASRDEARTKFSALAENGLVTKCSLTDE